jgi:very-short-patch-repair endonuclease
VPNLVLVDTSCLIALTNIGELSLLPKTFDQPIAIQMSKAKIFYFTLRDEQRKEEKLEWFKNTRFQDIPFERITPDENGNWINLADTDFKTLLPLANKQTKLAKTKAQENAVFKLFSLGVVTARDEWVYDFDEKNLERKVKFFCEFYEKEKARWEKSDKKTRLNDFVDRTIKWTEELEAHLERGSELHFNKKFIRESLYRPFVKKLTYFDRIITHRIYQNDAIFPIGEKRGNVVICVNHTSTKPFNVLAVNMLPDYHFNGDANCLPLYRYTESGERVENITDWGLEQFRARYEPSPQPSPRGRGGESASLSSGSMPSPQPSPDGRGSVGSESPLPVGEDLGEGRVGKGRKPKLPEALLRAARELRRKATDAEKYLWSLLRNRQLAGYKFRRQHPLGRFVLDFYCHEAKLCVELDGGQHAEPAQADYDRERTVWLNREGIRVIRFWNTDVLNNIEGVLQSILIALTTPVEQEVKRRITKEDIFHYVYAVLHNPAYRKKYELDLKRELPRVPFYDDFWKWAAWGKCLMELHLNYESVEPFGLKRVDVVNIPSPQPSPSGRGSESASLSSGRGSESASLSSGRGSESASLSSGRGSEESEGSGSESPLPVGEDLGEGKESEREEKMRVKVRLKANKEKGIIEIDEQTTLSGVPKEAWDYKLGNRSALEWILDQYKETKPKDKTIAEKFYTYRFADYKERVIDLLQRVCTVSVETVKIMREMERAQQEKK